MQIEMCSAFEVADWYVVVFVDRPQSLFIKSLISIHDIMSSVYGV